MRRREAPMNNQYYVYMLTNRRYGVLYTGVTGNLHRRLAEHRKRNSDTFTGKYRATRLVYVESTSNVRDAIAREKEIKSWLRSRKIALIEGVNPEWRDLSTGWP